MKRYPRSLIQGFSMVEMIGVIAVVAVIAAMLIPKIFEAINNAKISSTIASFNTLANAVSDHQGKWGHFSTSLGAPITNLLISAALAFDTAVLLHEGLLDKGFNAKIGSQTDLPSVQLRPISLCGPGGNNPYKLDGVRALNGNDGAWLLEVVVHDVAAADAWELSRRLDGIDLSASTMILADNKGRVEYASPINGLTDVCLHMAHR